MTSKTEEIETSVDSTRTAEGLGATLYLRGGGGGPVERRQTALHERLETIREEGELAEATVERWAPSVVTPAADASADGHALAIYRELETAVAEAGGRLEPFFERQQRRGGLLVGRPDGERITFPVACIVVRRESRVTGVYPYWLDGTHHSVEDGLDALAGGDPENLA